MYTRTLEHHGILGMKWGVRRYQNKDGSLTPAGKKHVGAETNGPSDRITIRQASKNARQAQKIKDISDEIRAKRKEERDWLDSEFEKLSDGDKVTYKMVSLWNGKKEADRMLRIKDGIGFASYSEALRFNRAKKEAVRRIINSLGNSN